MALISKPNTFTVGAVIIASEHNSNFDTIYSDYNGNITNANISASANISDTKLGQITTSSKVSTSAITGTLSGASGGVPTGAVLDWTTLTAPTGYLLCDGSAVSRSTYAALFAVIGTSFGVGDGTTTFNVPPAKGRARVAYDASQTEFNTIGQTGGEKTHTLLVAEVPGLTYTVAADNGGSTSTTSFLGRSGSSLGTFTGTTSGGGGAHQNLQPYLVLGPIIIKT